MNESIASMAMFSQADSWDCGTMRSVSLLALPEASGLPIFKDFPEGLPSELPSTQNVMDAADAVVAQAAELMPVSIQDWDSVIATPRAAQAWLDGGSIPVAAPQLRAVEEDDEEDSDSDSDEDTDEAAPTLIMSS